MQKIAREVSSFAFQGREMVLVTSGAIGAGVGKLKLSKKPDSLSAKQAVAAVGQGVLLRTYEEFFNEYERIIAQILLTRDDFSNRRRYLNARNTFNQLFRYKVIPVVNENDTVAVEEIRWGDNDTLAAMVAGLIDADFLILLSDIDGFFTADPRLEPTAKFIPLITKITPELYRQAGGVGSSLGTGGMITKLTAAQIALESGIPVVLANADHEDVLAAIVEGKEEGTLFWPENNTPNLRKRWIAFASNVKGEIIVDEGAKEALLHNGKSLLPAGVIGVRGEFPAGSIVKVLDTKNKEIARGIVNYSSEEIKIIKGLHSSDVPKLLGTDKEEEEIIHRDNLFCY